MTPDQIILIDKPAGLTSFGVVARVRRRLSQKFAKRVKVGHTGTLDPFATGLMILVTGRFTKQAGQFSKLDKVYQATFHLGQTSTTGDPEGEKTKVSNRQPTPDEINQALGKFTGTITQVPPIFSAIKIGGQRAYKLARTNKTIDLPARQVNVYYIKLLDYTYPDLTIEAKVSSGTYIRSLGVDIGTELGTGALTSKLRRLQVGEYDLKQAVSLDDFMNSPFN
jgi:tRNA pseudouridine55 synthase